MPSQAYRVARPWDAKGGCHGKVRLLPNHRHGDIRVLKRGITTSAATGPWGASRTAGGETEAMYMHGENHDNITAVAPAKCHLSYFLESRMA